jgi:hypothetical protein
MISTEMDVVDSARARHTDIQLPDSKIDRGLFASIALNLILDGLPVVERTQPGPLNSRDVDEHIFATAA